MRIAYSPDADVLTIHLRDGRPVDSRDIAEGIIVHLSAKGQPLEIEILDASKVIPDEGPAWSPCSQPSDLGPLGRACIES